METNQVFETQVKEFIVPTGHKVRIREQNGADEDILSNPVEASNFMNLSRFIANIVVWADYNESGKLTPSQAQKLPTLDRYCIIMQSRIFSLGETLEFQHDWGKDLGGIVNYEQDLREFLFDDYASIPSEEEIEVKPHAIPIYPNGNITKDIPFTTQSGKELLFDLMTAEGEALVANLPLDKQTKNSIFIARNLRLKVGNNYDKVTNFSLFTAKDMKDIRANVLSYDPIFSGITSIENPITKDKIDINIMGIKDFFYLGEI